MGFIINKDQGSGKATISVTPEEKNTLEEDVITYLTVQSVDGSTKQVKLVQKAAEPTWEYTFRVNPTELQFSKDGGSQTVQIFSTKQKIINGNKVGDPEEVTYTRTNLGDISGSSTTITMAPIEYTIEPKGGQAIFVQAESGKEVIVNCVQIIPAVKPGTIVMFSGTTPPEGWEFCDGQDGRPDMRGKFVVGYDPSSSDYGSIGNTGGEKEVTLTVAQMPRHDHSISNEIDIEIQEWGDNANKRPFPVRTSNYRWTGYTGGSQPHENRPPYYTVAYIIKI